LPWQIAIASGREFEGLVLKPQQIQATFDPGCQKIDFARHTLKDKKGHKSGFYPDLDPF